MAELRCAVSMGGVSTLASLQSLRGTAIESRPNSRPVSAGPLWKALRAATQSTGGGTQYIGGKKVKVLPVGDKSAKIRDKVSGEPQSIKLLARVEQLKLLSKAEKAGLLSAAESLGLSLSSIEKLGLLSKAESFGVLSAATDPKTSGALLTLALILLIAGPLFVYLIPEDSSPLVVLQVVVAAITVLGGSAAFAASNFVSALQKSE